MRFLSYLNTAVYLIGLYDGSMPLVHFLKHYFAQHKKHGSKDRKLISHLCYCYYRLGKALPNTAVEEKVRVALFLCDEQVGVWQPLFQEDWIGNWNNDLQQRLAFVKQQYQLFDEMQLFAWNDGLSDGINAEEFAVSHLIQPNLFVRIRPGFEDTVLHRLKHCEIPFKKIGTHTLAMANGTKLEQVVDINREVVIQDMNSQNIQQLLSPKLLQLDWTAKWKVWNCCTASGGKTILLHDVHPNNELLLTDVRETMLPRLRERLTTAKIGNWNFKVVNVAKGTKSIQQQFDLVIADVPCTGSGTWARTPEQMQFFSTETISQFASLQQNIVANAAKHVQKEGYFLYITCSVFKQENEDNVAFIQKNCNLQLVKQVLLQGFNDKADSMFAALFTTA